MKKLSDGQKYKLIIWYYLLKDIKENNIEDKLKKKYPWFGEFKIDYGEMAERIRWSALHSYARSDIYPWVIQTKNKEGVMWHVAFKELCAK